MRNLKYKTIFLTVLIILNAVVFPIESVLATAGKFDITYEREYVVEKDKPMHVSISYTIQNNTSNYYLEANSEGTFYLYLFKTKYADASDILNKQIESAHIYNENNQEVDFTSKIIGSRAELNFTYGKEVSSGQSVKFRLEYDNYELFEKIGAVWNIYVPGFAEDENFTSWNNVFHYYTTVKVESDIGKPNFVLPETFEASKAGNYRTYKFPQEALLGKSVWIEYGEKQIYKFEMKQEVRKGKYYITEGEEVTSSLIELIVPSDLELGGTVQKIYFENWDPAPKEIQESDDGYLIAHYEVPVDQSEEIVINGYAEVSQKNFDSTLVNDVSEIPEDMKRYTQACEYWEADDEKILAKAVELQGEDTNVYYITLAVYDYIVQNIDYDNFKFLLRKSRQGAVATLEGGTSVCMEYSDLSIALLRSLGIPARAAIGYGFDPKEDPDRQELHQWTEVWMPGIDKWVSVDVTWGESGRSYIGGDLDHFFWYVASDHPEEPEVVSYESEETGIITSFPEFSVETVAEIPLSDHLEEVSDLLPQEEVPEVSSEEDDEGLDLIGVLSNKFVYIGAAICCGGSVLIIAVVGVIFIRRRKRRKAGTG